MTYPLARLRRAWLWNDASPEDKTWISVKKVISRFCRYMISNIDLRLRSSFVPMLKYMTDKCEGAGL